MTDQQKAYKRYAIELFNEGDHVKVVMAWKEDVGGCNCYLDDPSRIGMIGRVVEIDEDGDVVIKFKGTIEDEHFAAFALEKVATPVKEMTVSEISKELGYEVKIVK